MIRCLSFFVFLVGVLFLSSAPVLANTPSGALSTCQSAVAAGQANDHLEFSTAYCNYSASWGGYIIMLPYDGPSSYTYCSTPLPGADCHSSSAAPPPNTCNKNSNITGSIVAPAGSGLPLASYGGCCYAPINAMSNSNAAGQQLVIGDWEPTGDQCDGSHPGLSTSSSNNPASSSTAASPYSETSNPDGSKTYCDTQNDKCLTVQNPSGPPASSSSSANNSTNWNSTTNNPATASSTTTTTTTNSTTTASGSGPASGSSSGGAPGTWTTTGQQTSKSVTDQPASSSSTSGKCTFAVCDVGQADGQVGQMYTGSGDSVQAEFASFRAQVASTPFAAAVPAFFTFNPSGACPTWHIPGNAYWGQAGFDFTFFCNPAILAILSAAGWIVLAVGAFSAFRIALY